MTVLWLEGLVLWHEMECITIFMLHFFASFDNPLTKADETEHMEVWQ